MNQNVNFGHIAFPVYVEARAAGSNCNLNCAYCRNSNLSEQSPRMSYEVLERFTKQYIEAQIHSDVNFFWSGGEPLLSGIDFFEKAIELQQKYSLKKKISNTVYTNGTLINNDWCRLFKKNNFSVNVTLDGPKELHNCYRTTMYGVESYEYVMNGINLLKRYDINTSYTIGVHSTSVKCPNRIYEFIRHNNLSNIEFKPYISYDKLNRASWGIDADQYGEFLCAIFDLWVRRDIGKIKIMLIDNTLKALCNEKGNSCTFSQTCGHRAVLKSDGQLYACKKFIFSDHHLGDMYKDTITGLMYSRKQIKFGQTKRSNLTKQCKRCSYLRFCNGGCPKDRIALSNAGEKGHNILCHAYHSFFEHSFPALTFVAEEISHGGLPERIMTYFDAY